MPEKIKSIVYIVDDDESVRRAMKRLISSAGLEARIFVSGRDFLESNYTDQNACLIADVKMHGMTGLELQQELISRGSTLPVIFLTAFDAAETRDQAKKAGAAGYFRKPVDDQALLDSIHWALTTQVSQGRP